MDRDEKDVDVAVMAATQRDTTPRVLVTGASGFIASRLIYDLLQTCGGGEKQAPKQYHVRGTVRGDPRSPRYDQLRQLAQRAVGNEYVSAANSNPVNVAERFELVSLDLNEDEGWDR